MECNALASLRLLLELGADVRAAGCLVAVDNNRPPMLRLLLDAGADPEEKRHVEVVMTSNKKSRDERPLYIAAKHGHEACVRMLLDHGVELGGAFWEEEGYFGTIRIFSLCHCMQNLISTIADKRSNVFSNFCVTETMV